MGGVGGLLGVGETGEDLHHEVVFKATSGSRQERADKRESEATRESRQEREQTRESRQERYEVASEDLHDEVVLEAPEEVERGQQQQPCRLDILRWAPTLCDGHRYLQTHPRRVRDQYSMVFKSG
jgi:hypothetical protein